jgi:tRNA modification GTPase
MLYPLDDTIVAIASAPGGAARGILRTTGPAVPGCLLGIFRPQMPVDWPALCAATVVAGSLALDAPAAPLPGELYVWPTSRSFTGQPVAEFHTLGSPPLLEAALRAVCGCGARLAEPGEFTLRAFLCGRLDLTQAEAVLGVIDAVGQGEFQAALAQLAGGLAVPLRRLRELLLDLLAHLEAGFDFADEDLPFITADELQGKLAEAAEAAAAIARQMESRTESGGLVRTVFTGWPNVGKSSLFNALAGRSQALVSHHPGTTRDYLTAECELGGGVRCLLVDTAGVEPVVEGPAAEVRRSAQAAAQRQSQAAQVRVLCLDSTRPLNAWERAELASPARSRLVVLTKTDAPQRTDCPQPALATSALSGKGIAALREQLRRQVLAAGDQSGEVVAGTAARCRESLRLAAECLVRAGEVLSQGQELVAAELRLALEDLGKAAGAVYTDELLDRIFSRFCIGK